MQRRVVKMEKVKRIQVTEMTWSFTSETQLTANRLVGECVWFDKIMATIVGDGVTPIHFVIELHNHDGISSQAHDRLKELLALLCHHPNVAMVNELGRFQAKYMVEIDFRLQKGVTNTYRACDGFKTIVNALWFGDIYAIRRPFPQVVQRTIVDDGIKRTSYGEWLDGEYFGLDERTLLQRLYDFVGKKVRLKVEKPQVGGYEEHVGTLGVLEHKGWILDGNTTVYWPLVCVNWVDELPE